MSYAGDISPEESWRLLAAEPAAGLVDVRTDAEWSYVGLPDLSELGKEPLLVSWQRFPTMAVNPDFAAELERRGLRPDQPVLFLCRSGVRSRAAAIHMTALGWGPCYNIDSGFEGALNAAGHRGALSGWKAAGLPWKQG